MNAYRTVESIISMICNVWSEINFTDNSCLKKLKF